MKAVDREEKTRPLPRLPLLVTGLTIWFAGACSLLGWSPGSTQPEAITGFTVDTSNRNDVISFYHCIYVASEGYSDKVAWSGDFNACDPGGTGAGFRDDVIRRLNWFRAMAGVPAIVTEEPALTQSAQDYAFLMARNDEAVAPAPVDWLCQENLDTSAGPHSSRALGAYGPRAVDFYMFSPDQPSADFRRRLLALDLLEVGTGDVPFTTSARAANALLTGSDRDTDPPEQFVAWPPAGYVPFTVAPRIWSLSYPGADFSSATVTLTADTGSDFYIPIPVDDSHSDGTLLWELPAPENFPEGVPVLPAAAWGEDAVYRVTISGIVGAPQQTIGYEVTVIDPNRLSSSPQLTGPMVIALNGADYQLSNGSGGEEYVVGEGTFTSPDAWVEGAEDGMTRIIDQTPSLQARINPSSTTLDTAPEGSKVFHLAFPNGTDLEQIIELDRLMTPVSQVTFSHYRGFATEDTRLSLEVSFNDGLSWAEAWGRSGNYTDGTDGSPDTEWQEESVDLSDHLQGLQAMRLRFRLHFTGPSVFVNGGEAYGFLIDNIQAPQALTLRDETDQAFDPDSPPLTFNSALAGETLVDSVSNSRFYFLRPKVRLGCQWFPGNYNVIVAVDPPAGTYYSWIQQNYPQITSGPYGNFDGDWAGNGAEFVWNQVNGEGLVFDPTAADARQFTGWTPTIVGGQQNISFSVPPELSGVNFTAEFTENWSTWTPLPNGSTPPDYSFTLPDDRDAAYMRVNATIAPLTP